MHTSQARLVLTIIDHHGPVIKHVKSADMHNRLQYMSENTALFLLLLTNQMVYGLK